MAVERTPQPTADDYSLLEAVAAHFRIPKDRIPFLWVSILAARDLPENSLWRRYQYVLDAWRGRNVSEAKQKNSVVTTFGPAVVGSDSVALREGNRLGYLLGYSGFLTMTGGGPKSMDATMIGAMAAHRFAGGLGAMGVPLPFADGQTATIHHLFGLLPELEELGLRQSLMLEDNDAVIALPDPGDGTIYEVTEVIVKVSRGLFDWYTAQPNIPIIFVEPDDAAFKAWSAYRENVVILGEEMKTENPSIRPGTRHMWRIAKSAREAVDIVRHWQLAMIEAPWDRSSSDFSLLQQREMTPEELDETERVLNRIISELSTDSPARGVKMLGYTHGDPRGPRLHFIVDPKYPHLAQLIIHAVTEAMMNPDIPHSFDPLPELPSDARIDRDIQRYLRSLDGHRTVADGRTLGLGRAQSTLPGLSGALAVGSLA